MKRLAYAAALLAAAGLLLASGCRKDDDEQQGAPCLDERDPACENYDPCWARRAPASAAFQVGTYTFGSNIIPEESKYIVEETDTVLAGARLQFRAVDRSAESFEWKVGLDARTWTDSVFSLIFPCEEVEWQTLDVQLVVARLKDTVCAPADLLRDTFVRRLHFVPSSALGFYGTYLGNLDGADTPPYEMEVRFRCEGPSPETPEPCLQCKSNRSRGVSFINLLNEGCEKYAGISSLLRASYREFYAERAFTPDWSGVTWIDSMHLVCDLSAFEGYVRDATTDLHTKVYADGDSIQVRFTHWLAPNYDFSLGYVLTERVFRGRRVQ